MIFMETVFWACDVTKVLGYVVDYFKLNLFCHLVVTLQSHSQDPHAQRGITFKVFFNKHYYLFINLTLNLCFLLSRLPFKPILSFSLCFCFTLFPIYYNHLYFFFFFETQSPLLKSQYYEQFIFSTPYFFPLGILK